MQVHEQYPEIYHYTTPAGLSGIIDSQALRASHARYLNDSSELQVFFDQRLPELITSEVRNGLRVLESVPAIAERVREFGGFEKAVADTSNGIVFSIRQATLRFNETYVLSFCTAADDWTTSNGLLSQWRAYGKDGGYAIAFDTKQLKQRLSKEWSSFHYQHGLIDVVHYHGGPPPTTAVPEVISESEQVLRTSVFSFLKPDSLAALEPVHGAATTLSCLYKHGGFREEREVRIVAIPAHTEIVAEAHKSSVKAPPEKPRAHYIRNGCPVPCIQLFGGSEPLPISRVIVGPHPDQDLRVKAVELMLRSKDIRATVVPSTIPLGGG